MKPMLPPGRFSNLAMKVNAFLLIAFVAAIAFMGLVAYKQGWFVPQTPIHFVTPNALGLAKGMPVKLYGFTIGSVADMKLAEGGVDVQLLITSEHLARIPEDSHAKHARESGVIGAAVIDIIPGKSQKPIAEWSRITFEPARGISEIVDEFRRQAVPAFNEVKQAMSQVGRAGEDVTQILAGLRREVDQLPDTHRSVRKLLAEASQTTHQLGAQAVGTMQNADKMSQGLERVAGTMEQAIPLLTDKLGKSIDSLDQAVVQLRKTGEEASLTLKGARPVLDQGESAAREASDVLTAAKRIWPLSGAFKESADGMLPIDSFEARGKARER